MLYVKEKFTTKNIHGIKLDKCVESVWLDINTEKDVWLRVGLFYRSCCPPPGHDSQYLKILNEKYINEIHRSEDTLGNNVILILGDFNYPDIDWSMMQATSIVVLNF